LYEASDKARGKEKNQKKTYLKKRMYQIIRYHLGFFVEIIVFLVFHALLLLRTALKSPFFKMLKKREGQSSHTFSE
jgi:hypothetical protein